MPLTGGIEVLGAFVIQIESVKLGYWIYHLKNTILS